MTAIFLLSTAGRHGFSTSGNYAVATPGVGSITDARGATWAVTSGGQITVNGVVDPVTGSVTSLIYVSGVIWQLAPPFGWYQKTLPSDTWAFDGTGPVSAANTVINVGDTTSAIVDANGYVWRVTSGGQITVNAVIDGVTNSVTSLTYTGSKLWQHISSGAWYYKTLPSDTWTLNAAGGPGTFSAGATMLGAQLGDPGGSDGSAHTYFDQFRTALGESPVIFTTFLDPGNGDWGAVANYSAYGIDQMNTWSGAAPVTIPLVGWPMTDYGNNSSSDFANIAAGGWDSRFTAAYNSYVNHGYRTIYIRPGWEMNGDWYPWSVTPSNAAGFAAAFRRIADHAHAYSGAIVKTVWNPGYIPGGGTDFTTFYPGDNYVDFIGIDTYGATSGVDPNGPLFTYSDNNHFSLDDCCRFAIAHNKMMCFPETGVGPGETLFQNNVKTTMQASAAKCAFVAIWDQPTGAGPNALWSTDSSSGAAWRSMFLAIRAHNSP
jgi:hypothetical protein